jgi:hypothetical protein
MLLDPRLLALAGLCLKWVNWPVFLSYLVTPLLKVPIQITRSLACTMELIMLPLTPLGPGANCFNSCPSKRNSPPPQTAQPDETITVLQKGAVVDGGQLQAIFTEIEPVGLLRLGLARSRSGSEGQAE